VRTRELLRKIDRTLDRMDEHMAHGRELLEQLREDNRLHREELQRSREESDRQFELSREGSDRQFELSRAESDRQFERSREESRRQHERDLREHLLTRAAIENNNRVTRDLLLQGQENRKILAQIEQGIHAQTQGLLHVLDELRGGRGPGSAPAT
jgi:hypothetical protein